MLLILQEEFLWESELSKIKAQELKAKEVTDFVQIMLSCGIV